MWLNEEAIDVLVNYYYPKAGWLQDNVNWGQLDYEGPEANKIINDPLMQKIDIYDCKTRNAAGFSNVLQDLRFGSKTPKWRWQKEDRRKISASNDEISWPIVTWLYVMMCHRITGSGASFENDHGYRNNIIQHWGKHRDIKDMAEDFGISSSIYPGEAIALGASSVYPLEITAAYSAISNNGVYMRPNYFYKIDNNLGSTIKELDFEDNYANPNEASIYLIRDMMRDVVRDGTAQSLRWKYKFNSPVAGKTGTTNNRTDAWFVGFTPQVCIGVWVGMDNPAVSIKKYGSEAALPIFAETIKKIYDFGEYSLGNEKSRELDSKLDWEFPKSGIVTKEICKESLKISNKYCNTKSGVQNEIFLENHIPSDKCNIKSHISRFK